MPELQSTFSKYIFKSISLVLKVIRSLLVLENTQILSLFPKILPTNYEALRYWQHRLNHQQTQLIWALCRDEVKLISFEGLGGKGIL